MTQRIVTGVIGAAVFLGILFLGGLYFEIGVAALAVIAIYELFMMKGLKIFSLEGILASFACLSLVLPVASWFNMSSDASFVFFGLFLFLMLIGMVFLNGKYSLEDIGFPFLAAFYVGFGFQNLVLAREKGVILVLLAVFIVWSTDMGAYFVGRSFGRHKLAPTISPNKTIEGSIGGILAAVVISVIMIVAFKNQLPAIGLVKMIVFAVIFSIVSQLGDLVESSIKRQYGVKDSGKILPGHGGILDRFDSLIFVFPIMHLLGLF